ncbi:MAG TPA: hypothetical protein VIM80_01775 [Brevefilum sp.]
MLDNMSQVQRVMNQSQTKAELALFKKAFSNGKKSRILTALINMDNQLLSIDEITEGKSINSQCYCGLRTVPINMIQGSESRSDDFDRNFNPLKKHDMHRWMSVAEMRLRGRPLPAVELIQIGERYIVVDGHHRISVARALGEKFIEANVTHWG